MVVPDLVLQIAPSLGAATGDTLAFGTPVNVLLQVPYSEVIDGYEMPWLKISYTKGEFAKVGFVLAHKLSLVSVRVENSLVILGYEGNNVFLQNLNDSSFKRRLSELKNFKTIDSFSINYFNNIKLKGILGNIKLFFKGEENNKTAVYNFLVCKNNQIIPLAPTTLHSDTFNLTYDYIFPDADKKLKKNMFKIIAFDFIAGTSTNKFWYYKVENCSFKPIPQKK